MEVATSKNIGNARVKDKNQFIVEFYLTGLGLLNPFNLFWFCLCQVCGVFVPTNVLFGLRFRKEVLNQRAPTGVCTSMIILQTLIY
jgi:hypothetical protein